MCGLWRAPDKARNHGNTQVAWGTREACQKWPETFISIAGLSPPEWVDRNPDIKGGERRTYTRIHWVIASYFPNISTSLLCIAISDKYFLVESYLTV